MNKFEEIVSATKLHDVLHKKDETVFSGSCPAADFRVAANISRLIL